MKKRPKDPADYNETIFRISSRFNVSGPVSDRKTNGLTIDITPISVKRTATYFEKLVGTRVKIDELMAIKTSGEMFPECALHCLEADIDNAIQLVSQKVRARIDKGLAHFESLKAVAHGNPTVKTWNNDGDRPVVSLKPETIG